MATVRIKEPPFEKYLVELSEREMYVIHRSVLVRQTYFIKPGNKAAVKSLLSALPSDIPPI